MKRNLLTLVIGLAFARFNAMPEGVGGDHKPFEIDLSKVKSWAQEGERAGQKVREITSEAEGYTMQLLLATAEVIAGTPSQEDWLTGYAKAWANPDTAKSRKGDARAVFEAYSLKDADGKITQIERVVSVVPEDVPAQGNVPAQKKGDFIKETKAARDWLKSHDGDFRSFLALARELRGKKAVGGAGQSGRSRKVMTEKQHKDMIELLPVASTHQAATVIEKATVQIARSNEGARLLVTEMQMTCNVIKQTSKDNAYLEFAGEMLDRIENFLSKRLVAEAEQSAKSGLAKAESGFQPAPAQAQEKKAA